MTEAQANQFYDGRMVWLADVSKLQPGDILLTRYAAGGDKRGLGQAALIRTATGGAFDHVLICTETPTFVEALGAGVRTLSLQTCFAHAPDHVRVLRFPDAAKAKAAATYAQLQVGREYSTKKAMMSVFPSASVDELADRGVFCSALVAQAFVDAGAQEFLAVSVSKTTPATLQNMAALQDITADVFRKALAPTNIEFFVPLDAARPRSLSEDQTDITGAYARALRADAGRFVSDFPEAGLEAPVTFYDCINLVTDAHDALDRIDGTRLEAYRSALAQVDQAIADRIETRELHALFERLAKQDAETMQRNLVESFKPHPDIDVGAMRNFRAATVRQIEARSRASETFEP